MEIKTLSLARIESLSQRVFLASGTSVGHAPFPALTSRTGLVSIAVDPNGTSASSGAELVSRLTDTTKPHQGARRPGDDRDNRRIQARLEEGW